MGPPDAALGVALAVPWVVAAGALAVGARPRAHEALGLAGGLGFLGATVVLLGPASAGDPGALDLLGFVTAVPLGFRADALAVLFAVVVGVLWPVATVYSRAYLAGTGATSRTRFAAAYAASVGAVVGIAFASNLLTVFVFYELLTVATYPLVVHAGTPAARRAGRRYVAYMLAGGVAVLGGTVLVFHLAGTVAFVPGGLAGVADADPWVARSAFALLVGGFGVKAALMPLHGWLPEAMVAPTPVSGLLHAVAVVKSGVFGIARVVLYVFGPESLEALGLALPLAVVAAVTMVAAGVLALRQDRLKRGLAYSTVSQLSYIVVGLAVLHPVAVLGALLHFSAHAFMKLVLFFCAGTIYVETHVERVDGLGGLGRRLPLTTAMFAVASAGLVGMPLLAGFVSKWHLLLGLVGAAALPFAVALLLAGLLKLLFFWPLVASAAFGGPADLERPDAIADGGRRPLETDPRLVLPVALVVGLVVAYGVAPTALPLFELAARVAEVTAG